MVQTSDLAASQRRLKCFRGADMSYNCCRLLWSRTLLFGTRFAGIQRPRTCTTRLAGCLNQSRLRCCPCRRQGGAISWEQSVREQHRCISAICWLRMKAGLKAHVDGCRRTQAQWSKRQIRLQARDDYVAFGMQTADEIS
jgi:hypothetical protein